MNNYKTLIIAEAGVNHNGSIDIAKKLIDVASDSGADYVKFQTFIADDLVTQLAEKAEYQNKAIGNKTHYEMLKDLELNKQDHLDLINYCTKKNIEFLSTAFDLESLKLLSQLQLPIFKIPSGEITNLPYLEYVGNQNKPVILSTGMSNMDEVGSALDVLLNCGLDKDHITILHCNTEYPTSKEDVNLNAMETIAKKFDISIGYSDHTLGIEIPIAAVARGAAVIEKHFTLDRNLDGPDHLASLEPEELKAMVSAIRNIEKALGDGIKKPSKSEIKNIKIVRKSIVAKKPINIGDIFSEDNIDIKRPGNGLSPMKWYEILGTKAQKNYRKDELI